MRTEDRRSMVEDRTVIFDAILDPRSSILDQVYLKFVYVT